MYRTHRQRLITIMFTHTHCILIMHEVARLLLSCEHLSMRQLNWPTLPPLALAGPSLATQATTGFAVLHWPPLALQSSTGHAGLHWPNKPPLALQSSTGFAGLHWPRRPPLASQASTGHAGLHWPHGPPLALQATTDHHWPAGLSFEYYCARVGEIR